jgi:hypothetical protein
MKRIISLLLFCSTVSFLFADQLPPLSPEEKNTTWVLKSYLGETNDSSVREIESLVVNNAARQQDLENQSFALYEQARKANSGWKWDGEKIKKLALAGNAQAQLKLAVAYAVDQESDESIEGIMKNDRQCIFWATKAALNGNSRAQWIVAMRKETGFDQSTYWLFRVAGHASEKSLKHAAMMIKLKENLAKASLSQLQEANDFQKTLSKAEQLASSALLLLNNIRHGQSTWGDRKLSSEEILIARKYFGK